MCAPACRSPTSASVESLKQALLAAKSIGYSTGPSGDYVIEMFGKLGIADAVRPKLRQAPSTMLVGSIIASGEAELGFQQANELSHFPGVDYLGPLPAELQETTWRSGGIMTGSASAWRRARRCSNSSPGRPPRR